MKNCTNAKSPYRQDVLRAPQPGLCTFKIQNVRFRRSETVYAALQLIQTSHPQARRYLPQIRRHKYMPKSPLSTLRMPASRAILCRAWTYPRNPYCMPSDTRKNQTECALFIIAHPVLACNLPCKFFDANSPIAVQFCIKNPARQRQEQAKIT